MHETLRIPEIIYMIFECVSWLGNNERMQELAALARTCRLFRQPAQELMWYALPSLYPLLSLLPTLLRLQRTHPFQSVQALISFIQEWSNFQTHAARVRILHVSSQQQQHKCQTRGIENFAVLGRLGSSVPHLLPNLRKLVWTSSIDWLTYAVRLFLSPSLLHLELNAKVITEYFSQLPLLSKACPHLETLIIRERRATPSVTSVSRSILGLCYLQVLSIPSIGLNEDSLLYLAQLPNLRELKFNAMRGWYNFRTIASRLPKRPFPALRHLRIRAFDVSHVHDFVSTMRISLRTLGFIPNLAPAHDLESFFHLLSKQCPDLETIFTCGEPINLAFARGGPVMLGFLTQNELRIATVRPLLSLRKLRQLYIQGHGVFNFDDAAFGEIARAWPQLEYLVFQSVGSDTRDMVQLPTFAGLLDLIEFCPKLQCFYGLTFEVDNILTTPTRDLRNERIERMQMSCSMQLMNRPHELAEAIRNVLPNVQRIVDGKKIRGRDDAWKEVLDSIKGPGVVTF